MNRQDGQGKTALSHASEHGHSSCVAALLREGANRELKDKEGHTAMMRAFDQNHEDTVRQFKHDAFELLQRGPPLVALQSDVARSLSAHTTVATTPVVPCRGSRLVVYSGVIQ